MEKNKYTEYFEIINVEGEEIEVTVQVPENYPTYPVRIIEKQKNRVTIRTEDEYSAISEIIHRAMVDSGYIDEPKES